jgi:hypothetical protein
MSFLPADRCSTLTPNELEELNALRQALKEHPASVHHNKMERFSYLMVKCLQSEQTSDK